MKAVTVLRRARKLIADPKSWIQHAFTRKRKGVQCYCALGAVAAAAGVGFRNNMRLVEGWGSSEADFDEAHGLLKKAADDVIWLPLFNDRDTTTHGDVLAVFDKAIAAAKNLDKVITYE